MIPEGGLRALAERLAIIGPEESLSDLRGGPDLVQEWWCSATQLAKAVLLDGSVYLTAVEAKAYRDGVDRLATQKGEADA